MLESKQEVAKVVSLVKMAETPPGVSIPTNDHQLCSLYLLLFLLELYFLTSSIYCVHFCVIYLLR